MRRRGFASIAGIDEAGRGALAGPVVAAAVILPVDHHLHGSLDDSKRLSEPVRERLFDEIVEIADAWGVGSATPKEIDEINIRQATHRAMVRAVESLTQKRGVGPEAILLDGNDDPGLGRPTETIVGGDRRSNSIAAASIVAKVTRDRLMIAADVDDPRFSFARHKGYGTEAHRRAILENGPTAMHRMTFLGRLMQGRLEFFDDQIREQKRP